MIDLTEAHKILDRFEKICEELCNLHCEDTRDWDRANQIEERIEELEAELKELTGESN